MAFIYPITAAYYQKVVTRTGSGAQAAAVQIPDAIGVEWFVTRAFNYDATTVMTPPTPGGAMVLGNLWTANADDLEKLIDLNVYGEESQYDLYVQYKLGTVAKQKRFKWVTFGAGQLGMQGLGITVASPRFGLGAMPSQQAIPQSHLVPFVVGMPPDMIETINGNATTQSIGYYVVTTNT
jgi:hypothetical protein